MRNTILIVFILLAFMSYFILGALVRVNINKDKLHLASASLKVYKGTVNVTECPYLTSVDGFVYLQLNINLTNFICNTSDVQFFIFTYHSNIYYSVIIVENKGDALTKVQSMSNAISNDLVILDIQPLYISFIICPTDFINCPYKSVDQKETIGKTDLTIYSACSGLNTLNSCITEMEFLSDFLDIDSNSKFLGSKIDIRSSDMEPKYETKINCRHGGYLEKDNESQRYKCVCPNSLAFTDSGPQCEVTQQIVENTQYLYILPNTNRLSMEFSLYSPAISVEKELFRIEMNLETLLKYIILDGNHLFTYRNQTIRIPYSIDQSKKFFSPRVFIEISNETFYFRINELEHSVNFPSAPPLLLDRIPLILNKLNQKTSQICINNFKINKKIVDLYTTSYSTCVSSACTLCKSNQQCLYEPFKSSFNHVCICRTGYVKKDDKCLKDEAMTGQLYNGLNATLAVLPTKIGFAKFKFRTVIPNGNLITFSANPFTISITILNKLLIVKIVNENVNKTKTIPINYYPVTDGDWHSLVVELTNYFIQVTLDEKLPYNSNSVLLDSQFFGDEIRTFTVKSVKFGEMLNTKFAISNLTTCYDTVTIFEKEALESTLNIVLNGTLFQGCDKGLNCSNIICKNNEKCVEKWQNSSCVCQENFTDFNGTCVFTKCISNPCSNHGTCTYNSEKVDYVCRCQSPYFGVRCENLLSVAKPLWWIAIIVAIILIIVLIILIICCCRRRPKKSNQADISAIQENTVMYNDMAGESDYEGPPINFELLKELDKFPYQASEAKPDIIKEDLFARKQFYDSNNKDLIIDHPLSYTFEGFESDLDSSISSESDGPPILPNKLSNVGQLNNKRK